MSTGSRRDPHAPPDARLVPRRNSCRDACPQQGLRHDRNRGHARRNVHLRLGTPLAILAASRSRARGRFSAAHLRNQPAALACVDRVLRSRTPRRHRSRHCAAADCVPDCGEAVQWPNERKPIFFMQYKSPILPIRLCAVSSSTRAKRDGLGSFFSQSGVCAKCGRVSRISE